MLTNGASLQVDGCEIQVARRKIKAQNMLKNRTSTISYYAIDVISRAQRPRNLVFQRIGEISRFARNDTA
jgi:hypothetical protein